MKAALLLGLALWQATGGLPAGEDTPARHLRVVRTLRIPVGASGQTCAVLDADVYAHAASESLNDVRLFALANGAETPFTLTESNTERVESEPATLRNLGLQRVGKDEWIVFDLETGRRPYTGIELLLNAKDFLGVAIVSARNGDGRNVPLGDFQVFDLSSQHLSRSTVLPLQESSFPELHVQLRLWAAPGLPSRHFGSEVVAGASIPPSREAQTLYTTVAATTEWQQRGPDSVATLRLPAHVPVVRAQLKVDPRYEANFRRDVTISAKPDLPKDHEVADAANSNIEVVSGEISQLHLTPAQAHPLLSQPNVIEDAFPIHNRQMTLEAVLAANLRTAATVEVVVANGADKPLPLLSVQLEMRQRKICFDASPAASAYVLMYGDKDLPAPVYDYSRLFVGGTSPAQASLGPEQPNSRFVPRADSRPFMERHPDLLWLGLLTTLAGLGGVAMRGARHQRGASH